MINKVIGVMIMLVIGLALLPVVNEFATDLTGVGGALADTTTGALVNLLPVIYVIILLAGAVGYIATSRK